MLACTYLGLIKTEAEAEIFRAHHHYQLADSLELSSAGSVWKQKQLADAQVKDSLELSSAGSVWKQKQLAHAQVNDSLELYSAGSVWNKNSWLMPKLRTA